MNKKFYRSRTNRVIWGVCGGLAKYFDVDPHTCSSDSSCLPVCWQSGFLGLHNIVSRAPTEP